MSLELEIDQLENTIERLQTEVTEAEDREVDLKVEIKELRGGLG